MNHELIMLREVKRIYKLSQSLTKEARFKAIKSHTSYNVKNGTMGQIVEINQLVRLRDDCLLFCYAVKDALDCMDKEQSRLLKKYYINRAEVSALAESLNASCSAVYGKLYAARMQFRQTLLKMGYDRQWLQDNFSHIGYIADRLKKK